MFVNDGDDHVPNLTGGVIQSTELVFDEAAPARPIIYVRIGDFAHQNESLTDDGGIYESTVVLPASSDLPTSMATFLQGIGLHGSVGNDPLDDYVDGRGSPSPFARLALKILYATPTNARF